MTAKIFLVDFGGTLIKAEIIEEANEFRAKFLEKALPTKEYHGDSESLYKVNREFVEKLTGLGPDMKIRYLENDLDLIELKGEQLQNQIATNLFQIGMFMAAKKHKHEIAHNEFTNQLIRIKELGYKLAIVSGVRTDIISGMLQIAGFPVEFDYIFGQPPVLGVSNEENIKELLKHGDVIYAIGDKLSDLEAGKEAGAKVIFAKWGHASGGEEEYADFVIEKPEELKEIIK